MSSSRKDTWASGDLYKRYVGRWSRLVAREFLAWLAVPPDYAWLDVGCGTRVRWPSLGVRFWLASEESRPFCAITCLGGRPD